MNSFFRYIIYIILIKIFILRGDDLLKLFIKEYFQSPVNIVRTYKDVFIEDK